MIDSADGSPGLATNAALILHSILERLTSFCCWKKQSILVKSILSALME